MNEPKNNINTDVLLGELRGFLKQLKARQIFSSYGGTVREIDALIQKINTAVGE